MAAAVRGAHSIRSTAGFGGSGNRGGSVATTFEIDDLPDLTPVGRWLLIGLAILLSFGVGAALGARWETILLWQHQTTFGTDPASPVTDPVFGRDIGFFLFQLPFLRLAQGAINGLLLASLVLVLGRYALGALRGSLVFGTPIRLHLAVLGGLYLLSVAAGYQLDKYELVYSDPGGRVGCRLHGLPRPVLRVRRADGRSPRWPRRS